MTAKQPVDQLQKILHCCISINSTVPSEEDIFRCSGVAFAITDDVGEDVVAFTLHCDQVHARHLAGIVLAGAFGELQNWKKYASICLERWSARALPWEQNTYLVSGSAGLCVPCVLDGKMQKGSRQEEVAYTPAV